MGIPKDSSKPMPPRVPKVIVIRHGETEWSLSGQHTGTSDIPLTARGLERVTALGKEIVGEGKLLDPKKISLVLVSPRQRAQATFKAVWSALGDDSKIPLWETNDDVREWDYGDYEGKLSKEIKAMAKNPKWDIYVDGCPNGDSPVTITARVDRLLHRVRLLHNAWYHHPHDSPCRLDAAKHAEVMRLFEGMDEGVLARLKEQAERGEGGDVVVFTHGHWSKVFLARWMGWDIDYARGFVTGAGSVQICSYQHRLLEEPGIEGVNWFTKETH